MNKLSIKNKIWKIVKVLFFTLPAMIPMTLFWIYPILRSGWLSFTDWDYMTPEYNYVGVENYTAVLTNSSFWSAFKTTFLFAIGTIIPIIILGLSVALLLGNEIKGKAIYRFLVF